MSGGEQIQTALRRKVPRPRPCGVSSGEQMNSGILAAINGLSTAGVGGVSGQHRCGVDVIVRHLLYRGPAQPRRILDRVHLGA